mmetsp:Transcript_56700/g.132196  ORF Transcript_56700/g.132196 Transcript_56700/m.132196 type:complete len:200 (-) Transcript_56700:93-692(-)
MSSFLLAVVVDVIEPSIRFPVGAVVEPLHVTVDQLEHLLCKGNLRCLVRVPLQVEAPGSGLVVLRIHAGHAVQSSLQLVQFLALALGGHWASGCSVRLHHGIAALNRTDGRRGHGPQQLVDEYVPKLLWLLAVAGHVHFVQALEKRFLLLCRRGRAGSDDAEDEGAALTNSNCFVDVEGRVHRLKQLTLQFHGNLITGA